VFKKKYFFVFFFVLLVFMGGGGGGGGEAVNCTCVVLHLLVGNPKWKRTPGRCRRRWEENIHIDIQ